MNVMPGSLRQKVEHVLCLFLLTLHASIAKAAVDADVAFSVPSASAYMSTTLSADNEVFAVVLATESL